MVADKVTTKDIQNLAKGILEVEMPDYKACRSAMSMVGYTHDTWPKDDEHKPKFTSTINKSTNTIKIKISSKNLSKSLKSANFDNIFTELSNATFVSLNY